MNDVSTVTDALNDRSSRSWRRATAPERGKGSRNAQQCHGSEMVPIERLKLSECSAAQLHRLIQQRIEHRGEISRRGVDDLQHFGGRGLLLQSLLEIACPSLKCAIGLGAGDRDNRLLCKRLHQFDLAIRKTVDSTRVQIERANYSPSAYQGH